MAKRNVVNFRIVNIPNDDAFKQLEEQGKVDPNAMYVSPDTSLKEKHITNCITEIPQDIKLELNSGTLTLKAGSKVYVPNGTGNYEIYTVAQDIQASSFPGNFSRFVYVNVNNNSMDASINVFSGNTAPTVSGTGFWYDTENNVVKRTSNSGATWTTGFSFPIAIVTSVNDVATSIDRVFNGFGYMGSTAFALPGVKALAPNGRNEDGTLKNRTITISSVSTTTDVSGATGSLWYTIDNNNITRVNLGVFTFNEDLNYFVNSNGQRFGFVIVDENSYRTNGRTTSFNPKQAFRAVDYSDTEYIANQAMPSDRYVDLTLGASGTAYTAPADGYIKITKNATTAGQYIDIYTTDMGVGTLVTAYGAQALRCFCPVAKGDRVTVSYTAAGTTGTFRFVFANGAK